MTSNARRAAAAAALALALGVSACGDDESTTTAAVSSSSTSSDSTASTATATEAGTVATQQGGFADASAALEADGFDVEEKGGEDLVQPVAEPKPVTAVAGATVSRSGSSGDLLVFEFASEKDARAYAGYNDDAVLTTELIGTIAVTSTANNTDLLDQAVAAIGG